MDIILPNAIGSHASIAAQTSVRKPPDVTRVESAPDAGKSRADMHNTKEHGATDAKRAEQRAKRHTPPEIDPDQPVGPPPSFQVNVLEMEHELQQQLALIETSRAQKRGIAILDSLPHSVSSESDPNSEGSLSDHDVGNTGRHQPNTKGTIT